MLGKWMSSCGTWSITWCIDYKERVKSEGGRDRDIEVSVFYLELDCGNCGGVLGNRGSRIKEKLESELNPIALEVKDISYQHDGGTETHFNVKVVSEEFEGKSMVKRHRSIYGLLQDELQNNGLQALSIVAKTPS
ncbi:SufE-like protein 1, chloroplastic/mitochondrial [Orobanche minor]